MTRPSPEVKTWPAIPVLFRMRISRWNVPWATRDTSSLAIGSFRKMVPRSQLSSDVVASTSSPSTSSRLAFPAIFREMPSRSSAKRRRLAWSDTGTLLRFRSATRERTLVSSCSAISASSLFQGFAYRGDHRLELLDLVIGSLHRFVDPLLLVVALTFQCRAQRRRRGLELGDLLMRSHERFLHDLLSLDAHLLHGFAQRGDRIAQITHLPGAGFARVQSVGGLHARKITSMDSGSLFLTERPE